MARKDDSVVKREEFLAALRSLEPVTEDDHQIEVEDLDQDEHEAVIAAIAKGVKAEAEKGQRAVEPDEKTSRSGATAITPVRANDRQVAKVGANDAPDTFEDMVRDVVASELRSWLEENLQPLTEKIVREEIRAMGRRRQGGGD